MLVTTQFSNSMVAARGDSREIGDFAHIAT